MLRKNLDALDIVGEKGDWCFINDESYIIVRWGSSLTDISILRIKPIANVPNAQLWNWNGSKEAPTLTPSILVYGEAKVQLWHGYLTDGVLREV